MSKAEPMRVVARTRNYTLRGTGRRLTPRQWRRIRHKYARHTGCPFGLRDDAKNRPTPRQRKRASHG